MIQMMSVIIRIMTLMKTGQRVPFGAPGGSTPMLGGSTRMMSLCIRMLSVSTAIMRLMNRMTRLSVVDWERRERGR
jgi:hypothetical protein